MSEQLGRARASQAWQRRARLLVAGCVLGAACGWLMSSLAIQAEAHPPTGGLGAMAEAITPTEVAQAAASVMVEQEAAALARDVASRLERRHLARLVEGAEVGTDAERALLADHLDAVTTPRALVEALTASVTTFPSDAPVGAVNRAFPHPELPTRSIRYRAVIPEGYTPDRPWPVHIALHGGGSHGTSRRSCHMNWQGEPAQRGIILLCPQIINGIWWHEEGELRILEVLADARRTWNLDLDRVSLGGASSGGAGVWHSAARTPWL